MSLVNQFCARFAFVALAPVVVLATLSLALAPLPAAAQTAKPLNLTPLLGKDFDAYEKVLGKAKFVSKSPENNMSGRPGETRYYLYPGMLRVGLEKEEGKSTVNFVTVYFKESDAKMTWKDGLKRIGINPKEAKLLNSDPTDSAWGIAYKGREWTWLTKMAPGKGSHSLYWFVK